MNIRTHLQQRHLNLELHRHILDEDLNIATFLCWNLSGQLVGYQQYNPNGNKKIFNNKLEGRTYYDAFNAITEFGSNKSRKTAAARFNYVNFGSGAKINARAMEVLHEMATV